MTEKLLSKCIDQWPGWQMNSSDITFMYGQAPCYLLIGEFGIYNYMPRSKYTDKIKQKEKR